MNMTVSVGLLDLQSDAIKYDYLLGFRRIQNNLLSLIHLYTVSLPGMDGHDSPQPPIV